MAKFIIEQGDPGVLGDEIRQFWGTYLPGTPMGRLDWMMAGNPAGPSVWLIAREDKGKAISATISIMPKILNLAGKTYRAGIVGDFMVAKECRVFGPALQIMRSVTGGYDKLGFDFIYTVPNADSVMVCRRAGFVKAGTIRRYAKVLNPGLGLQKTYAHSFIKAIAVPAVNIGFRFISAETYRASGLVSDPESGYEGSGFPLPTIENPSFFTSHRDPSYLRWRYLDNPLHSFSIEAYKGKVNGTVKGFVISTAIGKAAHMFDTIFGDPGVLESLLIQFSKDMRTKGCSSVSVRLLEEGPFRSIFEKMGFRAREDSAPLLVFGDMNLLRNKWFFTDGDRNV